MDQRYLEKVALPPAEYVDGRQADYESVIVEAKVYEASEEGSLF